MANLLEGFLFFCFCFLFCFSFLFCFYFLFSLLFFCFSLLFFCFFFSPEESRVGILRYMRHC